MLELSHKYFNTELDKLGFDDIKELRKLIKYHSDLYYNKEAPIISDYEYDDLFKKLEYLEKKYNTNLKQTSLVGAEVSLESSFKKVRHSRPMISLDNTYNEDELRDFDERVKKNLWVNMSDKVEYAMEYKFDWLWIELIYENWEYVQAITRGNWIEGEDVTENVRQIENIPKKIKYKHRFEVRWEIIMPISVFEKLNIDAKEKWEKIFSNPRNAASGSVRTKDINITKERWLKFFAYDMANFEEFRYWIGATKYYEVIKSFENMWFEISSYYKIWNWIEEIIKAVEKFDEAKEKIDFDVDWLVIKVNNIDMWSEIWWTEHHPRYAIAYKFPAEILTTKILSVDHNVGRTGTITPLAHVEPVRLSWAIIRKATLHNYEEVEKLDIRIWDTVFIKRAWEVIPKIISVVDTTWRNKLKKILAPKFCPSCDTETKKDEDKVRYYCPNTEDCPAQHVEKLIFAVWKSGFDIDWFWEKQIELFLNEWIIHSIVDIFKIETRKEEILELEWYQEKSVSNLINAIEIARNQDIVSFLTALWIPWVGKKTAKLISILFESEKDLLDFSHSQEELEEIDEIWPELANNVLKYFENDSHKRILKDLIKELNLSYYKKQKIKEGSVFFGKKVCITWSFEKDWLKIAREQLIEMLEWVWGEFVGSVSKNTDYVLAWEKAWSKKTKAEELGVEIIDLDYFLKNI